MAAKKIIYSITPFTLIDFPDKTACIIWFAGCNMKCLYCYNPDIVYGKGTKTTDEALAFLATRKGLLDGVVLSGGECTLHQEIYDFAKDVKKTGMLVKADTNGSNPKWIQKMIDTGNLDYVSLDFKAPEDKFKNITSSEFFKEFNSTLDILIKSEIPFEVRTTIHSDFLSPADIDGMIDFLSRKNYTGTYYLQHFIDAPKTIGEIQSRHNRKEFIFPQSTPFNIKWRNG